MSVSLPAGVFQVRELCAQLQRQGQAKQLQLDRVSAGHLAMETLLSLTSQRAGAWFKVGDRAGLVSVVFTPRPC